jgi:hypothetical protein
MTLTVTQQRKLCRPCKRQLAWLKRRNEAGGSLCSVCGFWRWEPNNLKPTEGARK